MHPTDRDTSWRAVLSRPLPVAEVYDWCVRPQCGAVVLFSGTVRDHSVDEGVIRAGVAFLDYEAYESQVEPVLAEIEAEARRRWPSVSTVAILHRVGRVELSESSVIVAVGSAHRPEAFEAARWLIDAVKSSAPIWKHEQWDDGADWGTGAHRVVHPGQVGAS